MMPKSVTATIKNSTFCLDMSFDDSVLLTSSYGGPPLGALCSVYQSSRPQSTLSRPCRTQDTDDHGDTAPGQCLEALPVGSNYCSGFIWSRSALSCTDFSEYKILTYFQVRSCGWLFHKTANWWLLQWCLLIGFLSSNSSLFLCCISILFWNILLPL